MLDNTNCEFLEDKGNSIQAQGNSIRVFKTTEERKREKKIEEEFGQVSEVIRQNIDQIERMAENHLEVRSSILKSGSGNKELDASVIRESKREIIDNALSIVCNTVSAQTAAIFLISKSGILERVGIYGLDREGSLVEESWLQEEQYQIDEDGFTGKVVKPLDSSGYGDYGKIQYSSDLSKEKWNPEYREAYLDKFGMLNCSVAIPLNGSNRTCGVLRVLNKREENVEVDRNFSENDVSVLLFLTTNIANALSNFRREMQVEMFRYMSHLLIQRIQSPADVYLKNVYQKFLDLLVKNPETIFRAAVLRVIHDGSNSLKVAATSLSDGLVGERDDSSRAQDDSEFIWITAIQQERLIIKDLNSLLNELRKEKEIKFRNEDWIIANDFKAVAGFPLVFKGELVGTLSLYSEYEYDPDSIEFVQGVADLLGSFIYNVKYEKSKGEHSSRGSLSPLYESHSVEETFLNLAKQWRKETMFLSSSTQMSIHPAYQKIIGLGQDVLPFLLRELASREEPEHWFWALSAITGENPVKEEQRGKLPEMKKAWLDWGKDRKYVYKTRGSLEFPST